MMARIIPWSLPVISGGAIGGYTPKVEPAPEPVIPYNFPYILDNIETTVSMSVNHGSTRKGATLYYNGSKKSSYFLTYKTEGNKVTVGVSGVEIVDTQNVSSVIAKVKVSGSLVYSYYTAPNASSTSNNGVAVASTKTVDLDTSVLVDISSIMTSQGGSAYLTANLGGTFETYMGALTDNGASWGAGYTGGNATITTLPTLEIESITVYNANGVAIQEWAPPEEEEE